MYVLALIFALAGGESKSEVIGAYSTLAQCEAASETKSSPTQCFFLDPEKGLVDVKQSDRSETQKAEKR